MIDISVIIPLYNKESTIIRAYASVSRQTYKPYEIIVVDDGSTDSGLALIEKVNDPKLKIIKKPNGGAASARNYGIKIASGKYIAFIDADDEWYPCFLEKIVNLINWCPDAVMFSTAYENYYGEGKSAKSVYKANKGSRNVIDARSYFRLIVEEGSSVNNSSSTVILRSNVQFVQPFPVNMTFYEDHAFWYRMIMRGPIAYFSEACVRLHKESENRSNIYKDYLLLHKSLKMLELIMSYNAKEHGFDFPLELRDLLIVRKKMVVKIALLSGSFKDAQKISTDFKLTGFYSLLKIDLFARFAMYVQRVKKKISK